MKSLPLEIPLPSIQRCDITLITKVLNEILTEETAELLDRLSGYANYMEATTRSYWSYLDDQYIADENAAHALSIKIRELLRLRNK